MQRLLHAPAAGPLPVHPIALPRFSFGLVRKGSNDITTSSFVQSSRYLRTRFPPSPTPDFPSPSNHLLDPSTPKAMSQLTGRVTLLLVGMVVVSLEPCCSHAVHMPVY